jgi:hypothetical protein
VPGAAAWFDAAALAGAGARHPVTVIFRSSLVVLLCAGAAVCAIAAVAQLTIAEHAVIHTVLVMLPPAVVASNGEAAPVRFARRYAEMLRVIEKINAIAPGLAGCPAVLQVLCALLRSRHSGQGCVRCTRS